jgi:hypothetical protein
MLVIWLVLGTDLYHRIFLSLITVTFDREGKYENFSSAHDIHTPP